MPLLQSDIVMGVYVDDLVDIRNMLLRDFLVAGGGLDTALMEETRLI